jgi:hypothetical protein
LPSRERPQNDPVPRLYRESALDCGRDIEGERHPSYRDQIRFPMCASRASLGWPSTRSWFRS